MLLSNANKAAQGDPKAFANALRLVQSVGLAQEIAEDTGSERVTANDAEIVADFLAVMHTGRRNLAILNQ